MAEAEGAEGRGPALRRLLVLTGVEPEARRLVRELGLVSGRSAMEIVAVGIGACGLDTVLKSRELGDTVIVSAGLCGALDPALPTGAVVVPDAVQLSTGEVLSVDVPLRDRVVTSSSGTSLVRGVLLAADRLVSTPALKRELWQRTRAVAVDMESGHVLAAAAARRRPALVVRGVVDTASETLSPELASVVDVRGRVRLARAAHLALRRPDLVPQAMRMARASRNALRAVAAVLAELRRSLSERPDQSDEDAVVSSLRNAAAGSLPTMTGGGCRGGAASLPPTSNHVDGSPPTTTGGGCRGGAASLPPTLK